VQVLAPGWAEDPATAVLLRDRAVADEAWPVRQAAVQVLAAGSADDRAAQALAAGSWVEDPIPSKSPRE
jgi:hypothetical protein